MTPAAIRDGFEHLRSDQQMLPLAEAARCRSEADWLVGINGTRAMTAFNSRDGGFFLTTVGRVQTPTLSIMVEREEQIRKHVSRDYWEVRAHLRGRGRRVRGQVVRPGVEEERPTHAADDGSPTPTRADRLWNEADAQAIADAVQGQPATRHRGGQAEHAGAAAALRPDQPAARGQLALRLLGAHDAVDRPGALREAQGADLPADRQQGACPRTTSRVAQADDGDDLDRETCRARCAPLAAHAKTALKEGYVKPNKRIFDNAKVSDHFAIIPTLLAPKSLSRDRGQALRHGRQALPRRCSSRRPSSW